MDAYIIIEYIRDSLEEQRDLLSNIEEDISKESWKIVSEVIVKLTDCSQLLNKADKL